MADVTVTRLPNACLDIQVKAFGSYSAINLHIQSDAGADSTAITTIDDCNDIILDSPAPSPTPQESTSSASPRRRRRVRRIEPDDDEPGRARMRTRASTGSLPPARRMRLGHRISDDFVDVDELTGQNASDNEDDDEDDDDSDDDSSSSSSSSSGDIGAEDAYECDDFVVSDDSPVRDGDNDDDDGFDDDAWQRDGEEAMVQQQLHAAHARVSTHQAFKWFVEYVVRAVLSKKWQEAAAEAEGANDEWQYLFSDPTTQAWNAYTTMADLAYSNAWKISEPFENWELAGCPPNMASALDAYPILDSGDAKEKHKHCDACGRERHATKIVYFRGTPYSGEYITCERPLADLMHIYKQDTKSPPVFKNTYVVGADCLRRMIAYHAARHYLYKLVGSVCDKQQKDPRKVLTERFYNKQWLRSQEILDNCRAYSVEGPRTRYYQKRYNQPKSSDPPGKRVSTEDSDDESGDE